MKNIESSRQALITGLKKPVSLFSVIVQLLPHCTTSFKYDLHINILSFDTHILGLNLWKLESETLIDNDISI